jgi:hypothetical protein
LVGVILVLLGALGAAGWLAYDARSERDSATSKLRRERVTTAALRTQLAEQAADVEVSKRAASALRRKLRAKGRCEPHLVLMPTEGPVGTRVVFVGDCFAGPYWAEDVLHGAYGMFLLRDLAGCEQIVGAEPFEIRRAPGGRVRGSFTVGSEGGCFQSDGPPRAVVPGAYRLGLGCHACLVATFRITA